MELLAKHLAQSAYSIAFPEEAFTTEAALKAFAKRSSVDAFRKATRGLIAAIQANTAWVAAARCSAVPDFAPIQASQVAEWERRLSASGKVRQGSSSPSPSYACHLDLPSYEQLRGCRGSVSLLAPVR